MLKTLEKYSTNKNIVAGIVFIIFINTIAFPLFPPLFMGISVPLDKILDLHFGFTPDYSYHILTSLQDDGRLSYILSTLLIDTPYAFIYGFIYAFILIMLLKTNNLWKYKALVYIPFAISFSDLLENTGIITLLFYYPEKMEFISNLTSFFNQSKWSFALIMFIITIANLIYYLYIKHKHRVK